MGAQGKPFMMHARMRILRGNHTGHQRSSEFLSLSSFAGSFVCFLTLARTNPRKKWVILGLSVRRSKILVVRISVQLLELIQSVFSRRIVLEWCQLEKGLSCWLE